MRNQTCFYSVQNAAIPPHYCPIFMVIAKSLINGVGDSCTHRDCQSANAQSMKLHLASTLGKKMPSMIKNICKCNWINVRKFWLICAIFFDVHRIRYHMANNNCSPPTPTTRGAPLTAREGVIMNKSHQIIILSKSLVMPPLGSQ